jgi:UDP-GlcNAc:undecaprenyl-phosphate GlcNAc-1-phosphate transferase
MSFGNYPISGEVFLAGYAISLALSLVLTWVLVKTIRQRNPLTRLLNRLPISAGKNVSPFGGIAVILSFLVTLWAFYFIGGVQEEHRQLFLVLTLGVFLMFCLGVYDDIYHCPPRVKLLIQTIIAISLYFLGFQIERIGDLIELKHFSIFLTVIWIVGITNSLNLIDGMDGLASGIIFLSCLTLSMFYMERNLIEASFLSVVLAGSTLGFLMFNLPPARIILGDTGSLPMGLLVSLITLLPLNQGHTDEIYYLLPVITLILPITDTTFAFLRRAFKGISPFSKDAEHFHHRLYKLGLSPISSISMLFALCLYFDLTALLPAYDINLIPKLIPIYFIFVLGNILILVQLLKYFENSNRHE